MAQHTVHTLQRLISTSTNGNAVFGCSFPGCSETEVRGVNQPSPYAVKRAKRKAAAKRKKPTRGGA